MKRSRIFLALAVLIAVAPTIFIVAHDGAGGPKDIGNSAPPGIGGEGPFQSLNMDLLGRLPISEIGGGQGNVLGSDCWGWTDPQTGNEYAIACLTNGTAFVDITIPTQPMYLGFLFTQTGNSTWRDVKVYDNHAFVVSDSNGSHGMQVFDLTNLRTADPNNPQTFSPVTVYNGIGSAHNIAINEDTGYAYIVGSSQASGGLHVVDISNPANPVAAGNFGADGYTHDAQIVIYSGPDQDYAGQEIAFASNEDTMTIVNVTNKNNMTLISRNGYPQDAYTHQCWLTEDQRYLYLCDELDESNQGGGTRTHVWDCLDLDAPVYLGFYSGTNNSIDHNLYIKDNLIYLASYSAGLRVLEIDPSQPTQLSEIAFYDTYATDTDTDFDGAWSCFPYYESGNVFVMDRQNGLFVVSLSGISFEFPGGQPDLVDPSGGTSFPVSVEGFMRTPAPGTALLHVDNGDGYATYPMNEISPNNYEAIFPPTTCGNEIQYYVSAEDSEGNIYNFPSNAPQTSFDAVSADAVDESFDDNFETNQGWTVSGDATTGQWERGVPAGDNNRGDPGTDGDGSGSCYLTGNGPGDTDIDGGSTILTSPIMDGIGNGNGVAEYISYYRWYANDVGNAPASDIFVVDISNDGGATWTNLETVGPAGNEVSGGWFFKRFLIRDVITPTDQMRLRFNASDLGDGSVVEAAVDGIKIEIIECNPTVTVSPSSYAFTSGLQSSGSLQSLLESDDDRVIGRKSGSQVSGGVDIEFLGTSNTDSPSQLDLTFEASTLTRRNVTQSIDLFNYDSDSWELVDTRNASRGGDQSIVISPSGDLSRFVQPGTLNVEARVRFSGVVNRQTYTTRVDQVQWTITD